MNALNNPALSYRVQRTTTSSMIGLSLLGVCVLVLISAPFWADRSSLRLVVEFAYYLALAQMWNLLAGYAGMVSVGQQAFVGLGGYLLFMLATRFGIPPLFAVLLSGVLVALLAIPTALIVFRLRGAYFAIGTWVVAEVFRLGLAQMSSLGGGSGQSLPAAIVRQIGNDRDEREMLIYFTALAIAIAAVAVVFFVLRSRQGLALASIRDSEAASGSLGVNTFRTKLMVYVLAAGCTGVVGALIFLQKLRISPDAAFNLQDWTAVVIFIVIIGGIGTLEGPLIGTLIYFVLRGCLAQYGAVYMIILGVVAVVMMLKAPQGVWGLISERLGWQVFPMQRQLSVQNHK
ncbi:branched-chain amino acid ABC transporter permease [Pseudomonas mandelii]|uniref:Branched-chain amino acid ABC transporter permease n=1 Tax=Pseudomonas mandelii TaxID=75612 RepID=A0A502IA00_9PSED|nr:MULTISPECIES: branched-chain amino acid ABC transporter permease [Pseudomonas]TPG83757.1 branched-chain amino acid ABC transporter permease [Pseudomonas mandelii]TPG90775.1 branched-chain amino acid ABC transporter permease [Pseudomonas caspiana]